MKHVLLEATTKEALADKIAEFQTSERYENIWTTFFVFRHIHYASITYTELPELNVVKNTSDHIMECPKYLEETVSAVMSDLDNKIKQIDPDAEVDMDAIGLYVVCYHSNIEKRYNPDWIKRYKASVLESIDYFLAKRKRLSDYSKYVYLIELNYGEDKTQIFSQSDFSLMDRTVPLISLRMPCPNHVVAQNYLFDIAAALCGKKAISASGIIFNTNVDDWYAPERIDLQCREHLAGFDIVSSDFMLVNDSGENITLAQMNKNYYDLATELHKNNNIICHPVVSMWTHTWLKIRPYDVVGFVEDKAAGRAPHEDLTLWRHAYFQKGAKFSIIPECLAYYRIHNNQIGRA